MRIVYSPEPAIASRKVKILLQTGEVKVFFYKNTPIVNTIAFLDSNLQSVSISSSVDGTSWTNRITTGTIVPTGNIFTLTIDISDKYWKITNTGIIGSLGTVYFGQSIVVKDPVISSRLETDVVSVDSETLGGVGFSKILYTARKGRIQLSLPKTEHLLFKKAYLGSNGFRLPVVIESAYFDSALLVRGLGDYPLSETSKSRWTGTWNIKEAL